MANRSGGLAGGASRPGRTDSFFDTRKEHIAELSLRHRVPTFHQYRERGALVAADIDLPPARYDHPYRGHVQYVYDFPLETTDGEYLWGYTVPPRRPGGKCLVHLSPIGSVVGNMVMTEEVLHRLIRHEQGHCNGWRHREEAFTLIGRDDPFIVGPENPPPWPRPPSVPPAQTTDVRQRFCVSVIEPPPSVKQDPEYDPNQWLAVREGPGAKFKVITKMGSVGYFEADAVDGDWTHVVDPEIQGWVSSKYVQECWPPQRSG